MCIHLQQLNISHQVTNNDGTRKALKSSTQLILRRRDSYSASLTHHMRRPPFFDGVLNIYSDKSVPSWGAGDPI